MLPAHRVMHAAAAGEGWAPCADSTVVAAVVGDSTGGVGAVAVAVGAVAAGVGTAAGVVAVTGIAAFTGATGIVLGESTVAT
jgi:hypothetical protein